jgi:hypothetical protein
VARRELHGRHRQGAVEIAAMLTRSDPRRHVHALWRRPRAGSAAPGRLARLRSALWREPLAHFLALGGLPFAARGLLAPSQRDTIVVDRATIDRVVKEREALGHRFYADAAAAPQGLVDQAQEGPDLGDLGERPLMLGPAPGRCGPQDLIGLAGPDVARHVFELPVGVWQGPMAAARGVHFVRVVGHRPSEMPPFEELAAYLRQDWLLAMQEAALAAKLGALRANYRLVVEDDP